MRFGELPIILVHTLIENPTWKPSVKLSVESSFLLSLLCVANGLQLSYLEIWVSENIRYGSEVYSGWGLLLV